MYFSNWGNPSIFSRVTVCCCCRAPRAALNFDSWAFISRSSLRTLSVQLHDLSRSRSRRRCFNARSTFSVNAFIATVFSKTWLRSCTGTMSRCCTTELLWGVVSEVTAGNGGNRVTLAAAAAALDMVEPAVSASELVSKANEVATHWGWG